MSSNDYALLGSTSGNYFEYYAVAIGENDNSIKEILRKEYKDSMTTDEAIKLSLKIFKKVLGEKFDINRFNVGEIKTGDKKLKKYTINEIKKLEK